MWGEVRWGVVAVPAFPRLSRMYIDCTPTLPAPHSLYRYMWRETGETGKDFHTVSFLALCMRGAAHRKETVNEKMPG